MQEFLHNFYPGETVQLNYIGDCYRHILLPGQYTFELWGARGGTDFGNGAGYGGYTKAEYRLRPISKDIYIYIYI